MPDHLPAFLDYLFVAGGLFGLFLGGEWLVRGAVAIARRMEIPPLVIGLTVVGFGTSMPELLVSVQAALAGSPDIAVGNVVGSNIANTLLIIGACAVVWPISVSGDTLRRDTAVMMVAALALVPIFALGELPRLGGAVLVAGLAGYLFWAYRAGAADGDALAEMEEMQGPPKPLWRSVVRALAGLVVLLIGARLLITGSVSIARSFEVSEAFIGLTVVALGTSLPELATALVAAVKRHSEIAIGNVVGSNIFNVLGILGMTAVISPIDIQPRFLSFDLPVMLVAMAVLTALLLTRPVIGRPVGAVALIAYGSYIASAV